jgi:DNA-binding beta-propeller fold protein YncE
VKTGGEWAVARFYGPRGLATSAGGEHLFVADYANSVVRWVRLGDGSHASHRNPNDSVGRTVATLPSPAEGGWQPYGVGRRGSIGGDSLATGAAAVDDRHSTATAVSFAEGKAAELAHRPAGVAVTPDGRVLLTADAGNTEVQIFWLQDVGLMPVEPVGWGHGEQADVQQTSSWDAAAAEVHAATQVCVGVTNVCVRA